MTLAPGVRLGPYEILAPIGAGGMGEVWRARDLRLGRDVAVKALPPRFSEDAELKQRLEREARAISQLSHPHVCTLFDVGRDHGLEYLVMELLEGETLLQRLARGALPLEDTAAFGSQIAAALEAAHGKGIVHRDLKPGNIMLTATGVKLLDFGLAKALSPDVSADELTAARTAAADVTRAGTILGTLSYMAPEQLEGRPVDARADIFSLGAVLYEMATGKKAFSGPSQASIASAILTTDPPAVSAARPASPPALDRLIRVCLAKSPSARWQSAQDVALQLDGISGGAAGGEPAPAATVRPASRRIPWVIAIALAFIAAGALWKAVGHPAAAARSIRFPMPPPQKGAFYLRAEGVETAISPDGSKIAFVASDPGGTRIYVRSLSDPEPRTLSGTEGAGSIFFSPDGRSIAFFGGGKLKRIDVGGGAAITICDAPGTIGRAGSWGTGGQILFAAVQGDGIYRVSAEGGSPELVVRPDRERKEIRVVWPWFLPDGRSFLYVVLLQTGGGQVRMFVPGGPPRPVAPIRSRVEYVSPGYLVFAPEATLVAQRFDASSGTLQGAPFPVAPRVASFLSTGWAAFATSGGGTIAYQPHENISRLVWFDRSGRRLSEVGSPGEYLDLAISPDGKRLLAARALPGLGTYDVWLFDLERGTETPVTREPENSEFAPLWMPDGRSIVYSSVHAATAPQLHRRDLATGQDELLLPSLGFQEAMDVTRDGRLLAFSEREVDRGAAKGGADGAFELWTLPLTGERRASPFRYPAVNSECLRFSPDGTAAAFLSSESGRSEAYVAPLTTTGERVRISADGAQTLRWSRDGREIFLLTPDSRVIAVPVRTTPSLEIGQPAVLFTLPERSGQPSGRARAWAGFDVSPDGKRFLAIVPEVIAGEQPMNVIAQWNEETKR